MKKFLVLMFFGVLFVGEAWSMQRTKTGSPMKASPTAKRDAPKTETTYNITAGAYLPAGHLVRGDVDLKDLPKVGQQLSDTRAALERLNKKITEREKGEKPETPEQLQKLQDDRKNLEIKKILLGDLIELYKSNNPKDLPGLPLDEEKRKEAEKAIEHRVLWLHGGTGTNETYGGPEEKIVTTRRPSRPGLAKQPAKEPVNAARPDSPRSLASSMAGTELLGSSTGSQSTQNLPVKAEGSMVKPFSLPVRPTHGNPQSSNTDLLSARQKELLRQLTELTDPVESDLPNPKAQDFNPMDLHQALKATNETVGATPKEIADNNKAIGRLINADLANPANFQKTPDQQP